MTDHRVTLARRTFLALAGGALAGLALPPHVLRALRTELAAGDPPTPQEWDFVQPRPARQELWARITAWTPVRANPISGDELTNQYREETVLPLLEIVEGEAPSWNPNNNRWYRVPDGYIYTATVQLIEPYRMPVELSEMPDMFIDEEPGFWAEVIVPSTLARTEPSGPAAISDFDQRVNLYYGSVHRVIAVEPDEAGFLWYKLFDDKPKTKPFYALARHMRMISPEALAPINPGAPNKRMEVSLREQRIDCYEGDRLVHSALMSSGAGGFPTPAGEWSVVYKQPARHMYSGDGSEASGGDAESDFFDLPGVPFNVFFTTLGHAIHGTWWHGDYGRPRSHGCLNVTPQDARWIWRWVEPASLYTVSAAGSSKEPGTPVIVT